MNRNQIVRVIGWSCGCLLLTMPLFAQVPFRLISPTYLCSSGFISFNTTGGDGTTITYSTTGIASSSPTSATGIVEATYRSSSASGPIIIEATQSGIVSRFSIDVPSYCARTFLYPVRRAAIPDVTTSISQAIPLLNIGRYFRSNDIGYDYRATFSYKVYGLPAGITLNTQAGRPPGTMGFDTAYAYLSGTPTAAGRFPVTVVATNQGGFTDPYSVADTFQLTVVDPALPVMLLSFTAEVQPDRTVQLNWTTNLEAETASFLVERSKELVSFEPVGEVSRKEAISSAVRNYRLLDSFPYSGTSYYRLTHIDVRGKRTQYPAISVVVSDTPYQIQPNPIRQTDQFLVFLDEPNSAVVTLVDASGRAAAFGKTATTHQSVTFRLASQSTAGMYILTVKERGQTRRYRLLVQ